MPASPVLPTLSRLAREIAESDSIPDRALVGIVVGDPHTFVISPPLDHLLDELLGLIAPEPWWGIAIVADVGDADQPLRTAWVAARHGESAVGHAAGRSGGHAPLDAFAGVVLGDVARRCVGLDTDPPSTPYELLDELCWLDLLVAQAALEPLRLSKALALRPTLRQARRRRGDRWRHLHNRTTESASAETAHRFEWMDTGMFSRWVLGLWPDPCDLVATLIDLVEPSVVAAVLARCPLVRARLPGLGTVSA